MSDMSGFFKGENCV